MIAAQRGVAMLTGTRQYRFMPSRSNRSCWATSMKM
jgi:hypothetical protein